MRALVLRRFAHVLLCAGLLAGGACAGGDAGRGGTVIIGAGREPQTLFPPSAASTPALPIAGLLFDKLADIGPDLNTIGDAGFQPRLAERWEWSPDSLRITFHLNPRAKWHDGQPVRAADVRFAFQVNTDSMVASRYATNLRATVDSVSVNDSVTVTAWFRQRTPEQFNDFVYNLHPLPEHLLGHVPRDSLGSSAFVRAPVGSGPFRILRWEPSARVELVANDAYYLGRPKPDRVIFSIAPEASTLVDQLLAGQSDFLESLTPADARRAATAPDVRIVSGGFFGGYFFLDFNLHDGESDRPHPLFGDQAVRRALSQAVDRQTLARAVLDSAGAVALGPFARKQWSADTTVTQLGFDRAAAGHTLDSLGWRKGPDGVRTRNGRPFAFTVIVLASSKARQAAAVLLQEQYALIGVKMNIEPMDGNAQGDRQDKHRFDAFIGGVTPSPSPKGIRESWTSPKPGVANLNYGRYSNPAFDAQVDSAVRAPNLQTARAHYRAAYQIIVDDAPAVWLYELPLLSAVNTRLDVGAMRPDAWWASVPRWSIARGSGVARDSTSVKSP